MATLTFTLTSTPLTGTKSFTVSDADVSTFIAYLQATQPRSDSSIAPTPAQALITWAQGVVNEIITKVQQANTTQAVPPPLSFT